MKKLLFLLVLINSTNLFAQKEWAPIGAKWYYNEPKDVRGNYIVFESLKDTSIKGHNCRVIDVKLNNSTISREYIFSADNSLSYYNKFTNSFHSLYNFNVNVGDTVSVHSTKFKPTKAFISYTDSISEFKYKIIQIDSLQISGNWVKRQKVLNLKNNEWGFPSGLSKEYYIVNYIGSLTYFFGVFPYITPEDQPKLLRCYTDIDFTFKNPEWVQECDFFTGMIESTLENDYQVFPNPTSRLLNINSIMPIELIELFDYKGLKIFSTIKPQTISIDMNNYSSGIFYVKITNSKTFTIHKIIKQ